MYSIKLGITKNFRAPLSSPCTASQKNVTRDTGHSGYAMLTSLAVEHMKLNSFFDELEVRKEEVEHLGAIDTYVYTLAPVWERLRRGIRRFVEKSESLLIEELNIDLPVPPCRVWEFCIEPQYRIQWICGIKDIKIEGTNHGRAGIGTVQYCGHEEGIVIPLPSQIGDPSTTSATKLKRLSISRWIKQLKCSQSKMVRT
jgi:hypothetical protein